MKKVELFEEALCCDTGVCGPSVDQNLLLMTAAFKTMADNAIMFDAKRYNLNSTPDAFVENHDILTLMKQEGNQVLPILRVDGEIKKTGAYPTLTELSEYTGVYFVEQSVNQSCDKASGCC
ncbi:arsenite efflux transporter metallochaperone ArsD [Latilactobacillus sakei]|uniref:arsenite efflux transporter metallochaperone ArsD n=1 Tax=Latilactobacillus sakei TaxID=1599 RepID=UPI003F53C22B